jgi:hypothetical protein
MGAGPDPRKQDLYHAPSALATPFLVSLLLFEESRSLHRHVVRVATLGNLALSLGRKALSFLCYFHNGNISKQIKGGQGRNKTRAKNLLDIVLRSGQT